MLNRPIFIIGSDRSGTNLLRTRIGNHPNLAAPPPGHIFESFYHKQTAYGDLRIDRNFIRLFNRILECVNDDRRNWGLNLSEEYVLREITAEKRSLFGIFGFIHDEYARKQNKRRWISKDHVLEEFSSQLIELFPECKCIYIIRDPRDVFLSGRCFSTMPNTPYTFAHEWKKKQRQCISLMTCQAFKEKFFLQKYEDLVSNPEVSFRGIFEFLEEEFEESILERTFFPESGIQKAWENLSKEIMKNNYNKYRTELSYKEMNIIETILMNEMSFFNYESETNQDYPESVVHRTYYAILQKLIRYKLRRKGAENETVRTEKKH